jgi:hypothetical protein
MAIFLVVTFILYLATTVSPKARAKGRKPTIGRFINIWLAVVGTFLVVRIAIGWFTDR